MHRFLHYVPDHRIERAVAANAGWYLWPDEELDFPYGIHGSPAPKGALEAAVTANLVILLGEADHSRDSSLRRTKQAEKQGATRLERGMNYYLAGASHAEEVEARFGWELRIVPEVAHDHQAVAPYAASALFDR